MNPESTYLPDTHRYAWPGLGVEVLLERFVQTSAGLTAEVTMQSGMGWSLGPTKYNLITQQAKTAMAKLLDERLGNDEEVDPAQMVSDFCRLAVNHHRNGSPFIDLRKPLEPNRIRWLIKPYVERGGPTVVFGKGGSGKSLCALSLCVSVSSGYPIVGDLFCEPMPTLYLDWEADESTHNERVHALVVGAGLEMDQVEHPIHYRRETGSLMESSPAIRKFIASNDIGFVVVDSLGLAGGSKPEENEVKIAAFAAARTFGVPFVFVDHISSDDIKTGKPPRKPFGGVYTENSARLLWRIDSADDESDGQKRIALVNTKRNNVRIQPRQAYHLVMHTDSDDRLTSVTFHTTDIRGVPEFAMNLPLKQRILSALRGGSMSSEELAKAVEDDEHQVRTRCAELRAKNQIVSLNGRWGLAAQESYR